MAAVLHSYTNRLTYNFELRMCLNSLQRHIKVLFQNATVHTAHITLGSVKNVEAHN